MPNYHRAWRFAFTGRFEQALKAIPARSHDPEALWLRASVACALGRFVQGESLARRAIAAGDRRVRAGALITLGSVLRQTERHRAARAQDARALRLAVDASQRAHALTGLAADAVGVGDAASTRARLAEAARAAPRHDWRARVRIDWVRAEHALLIGKPARAATHSRAALDRARAAGARRHVAKSLLFLGVALSAEGDPSAARALREAETIARRIGAAPIRHVARRMLATS